MTATRNIFRTQSEFNRYMKMQKTRLVLDAVFAAFGLILSGLIGLELAVALVG